VHSVGAWVALAAIIIIGPRKGKFDENGRPRILHGHSPVLSTAGVLLLWVGWIGFNGGSMLAGTSAFANVVVNTVVAGAAGGFVMLLIGRFSQGVFRPEASINGVLGGLVAITAGADVMSGQFAFLIGLLGGVVVHISTLLLERVLKLDDPLGAIPVHGFAGVFGTLAIPLFAPLETLALESRGEQFFAQAIGVGLVFAWCFGLAFAVLKGLDLAMRSFPGGGGGLRVSRDAEVEGLNAHEHDAPMGTGILQGAMAELAANPGDGLRKLHLEPGDDAYETSELFNRIVDNIAAERADEQARYERNKAERMAVEAEIAEVVEGCASGDYSRRLDLAGKAGFLLELCRGINTLCDTTETAMSAVRRSLRAVAEGDLGTGIDGDHRGVFGDIQREVNETLAQLSRMVDDVNSTVEAAASGRFDRMLATDGRRGFYLELAERMNALCTISERGLCEVLETLKRVGGGDLTAAMSKGHSGRFADVGSAVEEMTAGVSALVGQVTETARAVSASSEQLVVDGAALREDAAQQARSLERSTASLESMEETARTTAEEARAAAKLCDHAFSKAEIGHELTSQFSARMSDIEATTREIVRSLEEIELIAQQTNLLSLNASVEAVRGGGNNGSNEGFKVVALEVRELAAKSRKAVADIRTRTQAVQDAVAAGSETVTSADHVLTEIIMGMAESTERVTRLSDVGRAQLERIADIRADVSAVTDRSRHGAELSERNVTLARALEDGAAQTLADVARFTLRDPQGRMAA
jgi:Amt family ammonium transporter